MKNLLKLLKQYWKETFNDETLLRIDYEENTDCFSWMYQPAPWIKLQQGQILETPVVFSKSFGFIEWLVENDKIDFEKYRIIDTRKYLHQHIIGNACYVDIRTDVPNYEFILALLSIQDEPIEFLISILK